MRAWSWRLAGGAVLAVMIASAAEAAPPPVVQSLLDDGWTVLAEDPEGESRSYYRIEPTRSSEGYIRATLVVDFPTRSLRVTREFDCEQGRMRNRGATLFGAQGLQGEGRDLRGWNTWMGILFYESRPASDHNGLLADRVCPASVPRAASGR